MELINRMNEINEILGDFWHSDLNFYLLLGILLSFVILAGRILDEELKKIISIWAAVAFVIVIVCCVLTIRHFGQENKELLKEYRNLKTEFYQSLEKTVTVQPKDIVNSIPVSNWLCPHVELNEDETCTYVEFITDKDISQIFIPLKNDAYFNVKENISVTYLELSKEEREFINQSIDIPHIAIAKQHKIKENNWSLGVSVEK